MRRTTFRPASEDERGVALPAVIFLIALLTLLLTGGLSRVQADRQIAEAGEAIAQAFSLAQSGLQTYLGTRTARPPDGDSVRINLTGGYANVVSTLVQNPADTLQNSLYLIRSTGFVIDPVEGSVIQAQRSVTQFADWQTGSIERQAAFTAANGLRGFNGPAGTRVISGIDASSDPVCRSGPPAIAGLRTSDITGPPAVDASYAGSPDKVEQGGASGEAVALDTDIDWLGVIDATFVPDYTAFRNLDTTRSIQRVMGTLVLDGVHRGTGILIVTNDLELRGPEFIFDGIILVGGRIKFEATTIAIQGMVFSGLQELEPSGNPPRSEIGGGTNTQLQITYNSCLVNRALASLTGLAPLANGWQDAWTTY